MPVWLARKAERPLSRTELRLVTMERARPAGNAWRPAKNAEQKARATGRDFTGLWRLDA